MYRKPFRQYSSHDDIHKHNEHTYIHCTVYRTTHPINLFILPRTIPKILASYFCLLLL